MKTLVKLSALFLCILSTSCDSEDPIQSYDGKFDLSDAKAITFILNGGSPNARTKETDLSNLFKLDAEGKITSIAEDIKVVDTYPIKNGLFIMTADYAANKNRFLIAEVGKPVYELEQWVDNYIGQNDNEDLLFRDGTIFRKGERKFDHIKSNLSGLNLFPSSGNFAIISDLKIHQVINTVTNERYNVSGQVNNLWALSDSKVICGEVMIDFATGVSQPSTVHYGKRVRTSQGTAVAYYEYWISNNVTIQEYDKDGLEIKKIDYPGISGAELQAFFASDNYYVVQELSRVVVVNRSTGDSRVILSGLNVLSTSLGGDTLFYLAEDSQGNAVTAQVDLASEMTIKSEGDTKYDYIEAIVAQ